MIVAPAHDAIAARRTDDVVWVRMSRRMPAHVVDLLVANRYK
jgi:hypothetical protein